MKHTIRYNYSMISLTCLHSRFLQLANSSISNMDREQIYQALLNLAPRDIPSNLMKNSIHEIKLSSILSAPRGPEAVIALNGGSKSKGCDFVYIAKGFKTTSTVNVYSRSVSHFEAGFLHNPEHEGRYEDYFSAAKYIAGQIADHVGYSVYKVEQASTMVAAIFVMAAEKAFGSQHGG